ncbi:recombinase family protein [Oscillibacter sp. GMB15532]|uniref:recombinase family protein n=1 Tax=Oscillibacter sp. GMB15532 TaxID=3230022 RepID=UPI0034DE9211
MPPHAPQTVRAQCHRLSREDAQEGESNSISNQKALLTNYAKRNKSRNIKIFLDDGVSGVTFNRDDFKKLMAVTEVGKTEAAARCSY